jgi:aspartyl-tRNA(Asn)/glutamyl-tRNA(Gln) amidotransferase subunit A
MQATQAADLTIAEAAARLRDGEVSSVDLTRAMLERIERLDPRLNSYLTVTADAALAEAARLDAEARAGRLRGPLHGIPLALKDLFDTAGVRTTAGAKLFADRVPERDATVVGRLRQAGMVLLGKLNMHELAFGVTTNNPHFGACRNPWDPDRIPGGSSGGSGAAVAARLCYGSLGSDTGGSIRIPASLCGIAGLKPTYGRVSRAGVIPLSWTLDHVGPITRSVRDAALMLGVIAGHDPADPASEDRPVPDYTAGLEDGVRGMRIGLPRRYFFEGAEPAVLAAVEAAIDVLRREGAEVHEVAIADMELIGSVFQVIILAEAAAYHAGRLRARPRDFGADVRERLEPGLLYPATQYIDAQRARRRIVEGFLAALTDVDVLVTPTLPVTAAPIPGPKVETPNPLTRFTFPINVSGLPALSLPCGFDTNGLPIGLQFIGRPFDEATVLRAGRAYERATNWHTRRPPVS